MGSVKKQQRRFGKSTGINLLKRQRARSGNGSGMSGRPVYKYHAKKCGEHKTSSVRLKIHRRRIATGKKYRSKMLLCSNSPYRENIYSVCSMSENTSLKLKITRVSNVSRNGYRFVNLECLQNHVSAITLHTCLCPEAIELASVGKPPIKLVSELRTLGLASILLAECQGCHQTFQFETSPKHPNSKRYDINIRAVWGSMVTGNGPSHLNELLGTMDSPGMTHVAFSTIEEQIGEWWLSVLEYEMLVAGCEERQLAIDRGDYHGDVPSITVVTDGGWSKRTHKHSYNALGGVAIIIGQETKKLLHVGVRNKYCYICNTAQQKQETPKPHKCFKNWTESSQAMEADIIVEGFRLAEAKHGVRYMRVIGDGDSSVFAKIREEVPLWGRYVEKLECANHACKCLRSKLEKLVSENNMYKGKHHLTKAIRIRIVSSVRCAIRLRTNDANTTGNKHAAAKKLKHDIVQSVHHIFGYHDWCSEFCKAKSNHKTVLMTPECNEPPCTESNTLTETVIDEQVQLWTEGSSVLAQEQSRFGTSFSYEHIEKFIIQDVSALLSQLAEKSERLIGNITTNLAESWMHIRSKFDGGKLYNLCNRGSWHSRCYGGALRMNLGPKWSPKVWKTVTATEPGIHFNKLYETKDKLLINSTKYKSKTETHCKRWKRKMASLKQSNTKKAKLAYGPDSLDVSEDVTNEKLQQCCETYLEKNINLNENHIKIIENSTLQQSQSGLWHTERQKRITASNFGCVVRRNPSIPTANLVRKLVYNKFKGTPQTRNGLLQEGITFQEYVMKKAEENENVHVQQMGLVIDRNHKFLAASPDGKVTVTNGESGLVEVKNLLHNVPMNLWQAADQKANFCLTITNQKLTLKTKHDYFYQCHGLMNICNSPWIDFVVRTVNPYQLHIERLYRDVSLWETHMLPKLISFYMKVLLPELSCPREGKSPGIKEPGIWYIQPKSTSVKTRKQVGPANRLSSVKTTKPTSVKTRKQVGPANTLSSVKTRKPVGPSNTRKPVGPSHTDVNSAGPANRSTSTSTLSPVIKTRSSRRTPKLKFVGRSIRHQWMSGEPSAQRQWYNGTVVGVVSGTDGYSNAVHEVLYEGEDRSCEVHHLLNDYLTSSLVTFKFRKFSIDFSEVDMKVHLGLKIVVKDQTLENEMFWDRIFRAGIKISKGLV